MMSVKTPTRGRGRQFSRTDSISGKVNSSAKLFAHFLLFRVSIALSENKKIRKSRLFENEIGPGIFQRGIQQIRALQEYKK